VTYEDLMFHKETRVELDGTTGKGQVFFQN
jgi:hypothetical protein